MSATRECVYMPPGHTLHVGRSIPPASLLGPSVAAFIVTGATEGWAGIGRLLRRIVRWRVGLAPGYVAHVPAAPGPWTWRSWMPGGSSPPPSWRRFPTFGSRSRTFVAEGNTVAARVAFRGTHRGEGKVEENWVEIDLLRLLGQLGTIPELEHSEEANPT